MGVVKDARLFFPSSSGALASANRIFVSELWLSILFGKCVLNILLDKSNDCFIHLIQSFVRRRSMEDQLSRDHLISVEHSDETRERLLEVAAKLFAEQGFNKVTVRAICEEARTNVAAVNYHFRDKLSLYKEVVQMLADIMDRTQTEALDAGEGLSPEDQLRGYIRIFLHRLLDPQANPWMDKLMLRELMDPSPALDLIIEKGIKPSSERLRKV